MIDTDDTILDEDDVHYDSNGGDSEHDDILAAMPVDQSLEVEVPLASNQQQREKRRQQLQKPPVIVAAVDFRPLTVACGLPIHLTEALFAAVARMPLRSSSSGGSGDEHVGTVQTKYQQSDDDIMSTDEMADHLVVTLDQVEK